VPGAEVPVVMCFSLSVDGVNQPAQLGGY